MRAYPSSAARYDAAAVLARETGRRMAERLDLVKITPACVADIGCATGDGIRELQRRYPHALPLAIDTTRPMLDVVRGRAPWLERLRRRAPRAINADVRALPLAAGSLGLVWSNLMLHWLDGPAALQAALAELHRTLEVGGLLMFSLLGPDTLKELRSAAAKVSAAGMKSPEWGTARQLLDMHDIGDMLLHAGFAETVMDMEMVTLTYATPRGLLRDQRHLGVRDVLLGQRPWRQWRALLNAWQPSDDGRLPASFEVIYGHAWKAAPRQAAAGRNVISFMPRPA